MAAEARVALAPSALTGRRTPVVLLGNGRGGGTCTPEMAGCRPAAIATRRHLEKYGARDRTRTGLLPLDRGLPRLLRLHERSGQVDGICTHFPGFTGRCPADWATHLINWSG